MDLTKDTRGTICMCVLLGGITLAAFWPVVQNDFVNYDDTAYVTDNPQVLAGMTWESVGWAFRSGFFGNWHPLTWLSHMLDVQLFGLKAGWHHLTSLLLHTANAILLFLLLQRLTGAAWRSACVAVLFALHPLHVESVAWVSERKDVLSGFFFMLTLWAYARYAQVQSRESVISNQSSVLSGEAPGASATENRSLITDYGPRTTQHAAFSYLLSLIFFALGLMSKAMLVTVPFVLLLLDYWPLRRLDGRQKEEGSMPNADSRTTHGASRFTFHISPGPVQALLLEKLPFFALAAVSSSVAFLLLREAGATSEAPDVGLVDRLIRILSSYEQYLAKAIWPADLALPYPRPARWPVGQALAGAAWLIGLSTAATWLARRRPCLPVGWFWFLGMLVPVIGFLPVGSHPFADRYTYLPLIGLLVALVWAAADSAAGRKLVRAALAVVAGIVLLLCLAASRVQIGYWHDSERLYRRALAVTRDNYLAHNGLGLHLFQQGKVDEAIQQYEAALQINPLYDVAHSNLGRALAEKGRYEEAQAHLETALNLRPDDVKTRNNLGNVLAQQGRHEEAVRQFEEALRLKPDHVGARNNLAISCKALGRMSEAIAHYREALHAQPDSIEVLNNLAWILATHPDAKYRNGAEAVELATRVGELTRYQNPIPLVTLAAAYGEVGRFPEAISFAEQAQALTGGGNSPLTTRLQAMVDAFRAGQPYHGE